MAGLIGAGFDLDRILQHLYVKTANDSYFILDRKAIEALESALLVNDQLYRAVYYHKNVRAATAMMKKLLQRVAKLATEDDKVLELFTRKDHPLLELMKKGKNVELETYLKLTENHIWTIIEEWRNDSDPVVKDYASRLWNRNLHLAKEIDGHDDGRRKEKEALHKLKEINYLGLEEHELLDYYIISDTSRRKTYKEGDSIYLGVNEESEDKPKALEFDESSRIVYMLREQHQIEYVIYPHPNPHNQSDNAQWGSDRIRAF